MTDALVLKKGAFDNSCDKHLGYYGMCIVDNMKVNHPLRYLSLLLSGELNSTVKAREEELFELKLDLMSEIQKKIPRPQTLSFLQTASYNEDVALIVEPFIHEELKKAV